MKNMFFQWRLGGHLPPPPQPLAMALINGRSPLKPDSGAWSVLDGQIWVKLHSTTNSQCKHNKEVSRWVDRPCIQTKHPHSCSNVVSSVKVSDSWSDHCGFDTHHRSPRLWPWESHFTSIASSFEWDVNWNSLYRSVYIPGQAKDFTEGVNVLHAVDSPSSI
jgi:hypothetical protein